MATGQLGNTTNGSLPAIAAQVMNSTDVEPPAVTVDPPAPVSQINGRVLRDMAAKYKMLFDRYASEREPVERRWMKALRQYLGLYDPEVEKQLPPNRSRAYPRLTRVKCVALLSRIMNLMFPGNEDNWELNASPSPEMDPAEVAQAVQELMTQLQEDGLQVQLNQALVDEAVRGLADKNAKLLADLIKDQLTELGGSQIYDWIALNRKVLDSGIKYGIGVLEGPYVREVTTSGWMLQGEGTTDAQGNVVPGGFQPVTRTIRKPQYDHLPVWDFYPDMSARQLPGEAYFIRKVLGRAALRKLADRPDFFSTQVKQVITQLPSGNYRAKWWETDLKSMGNAIQAETATTQSTGREKYEVLVYRGPVSAQTLVEAGAEVPEDMRSEHVEAELWIIDTWVIKAAINPWKLLNADVPQVHVFSFDDDDTSPVSNGLPMIMRDSQLAVCASVRMALDNASVTCGPNMEVNTSLLRADQDMTSVQPYKIWYRDDDGPSSQFPAVRELNINGHLQELEGLVKMFMDFAEAETFIGPSTGGDFSKMPSEPMRTAAGASALRGDAALPFKDIVRNYDTFTQSVIWSLVGFNRQFNPDLTPKGDYDVIARGATSLVAKEVRGMQIDMLSQTMTPEERDHVDERKFIQAKFASRDMEGMLVSEDEAARRKQAREQQQSQQADQQSRALEAQIRETLSNAFKNIAQAQKNTAGADAVSVKAATDMIAAGATPNDAQGTAGQAGNQAA